MDKLQKEIAIVAKLMDEREIKTTDSQMAYDQLYALIFDELPEILDKGEYASNASIILELQRELKNIDIYNDLPMLVNKSIVSIMGNAWFIGKEILQSTVETIEMNTNIPMIVTESESMSRGIFALNYRGKLIELEFDEYSIITKELYKSNIEIRKLIRGLVLNTEMKWKNLSFLIIPEYSSYFSDMVLQLKDELITNIIAISTEKQEVVKKKVLNDINYEYVSSEKFHGRAKRYNRGEEIHLNTEFDALCDENDRQAINVKLREKLENILLDIELFYHDGKKDISAKVESLAQESLKLKDGEVKTKVREYHQRMLDKSDKYEKAYNEYIEIKKRILDSANEFDKKVTKISINDLQENCQCEKYKRELIDIFFKLVKLEKYDEAQDCIVKLQKVHYEFIPALTIYLKYFVGRIIETKEAILVCTYPNNQELAKIKVELSDELGLSNSEIKDIVSVIKKNTTGKEWFYKALIKEDEKDFLKAGQFYLKALDMDYIDAGKELIRLAEECPESNINIEKLADNLVSEANYQLGKEIYKDQYMKGVFNLKVAASKGHIVALEIVSEILFDRCKKIPWTRMKDEENIQDVNNLISICLYLYDKNGDEKYKLYAGLMYCKLQDYGRALTKLKDIDLPEAAYECAKMYQYGNGVAKDLKKAKAYYEKIKVPYKDTYERYEKVCEQLKNESRNSNFSKSSYEPSISYEYSDDSSSFCFITTAACLALKSKKDCSELNVLRHFRDEHIIDGGEGDELVSEYYRIGPKIVDCIDKEWNPFAIYQELWEEYIYPSCFEIEQKHWIKAKMLYIEMVKKLCQKYSVKVKDNIMKKYDIQVE